MRGSKYELKFDYQGKPVNEEDIRKVLKKPYSDGDRVLTGLGAGPSLDPTHPPKQFQGAMVDKDVHMEDMPQKTMGGTKKKFEDEEMQWA